ncbi:MAG: sensor histidine kinase [Nitrolancea sp.]
MKVGQANMRIVHPLQTMRTTVAADQHENRPAVVLQGSWLTGARLAFVVFASVAIWLTVMSSVDSVRDANGYWLAAIGDSGDAQTAVANGGTDLFTFIALGAIEFVRILVFFTVASLLVWRSLEVIAFVVALFLLASSAANFPPNLFDMMSTHPVRAVLGLIVTFCFPFLLLVIFYIFPDGRFTPRWTIIPALYLAGSLGWTFFVVRALGSQSGWYALAVPLLLIASAVFAQIYRYRRISGPVQKQQVKWFITGLGLLLVTFVGGNIVLGLTGGFNDVPPPSADISWPVFEVVSALASICMAVTLAIAVLKYRLFDLDLVINRALVYVGLTVSVVGIYILVVGYLGELFRTGGNLFISIIATALVAVVFQPLRERLQRGANRLLWGQRDEPYVVVAGLGRRLEGILASDAVLPTIVETVANALKLPYVAIALTQGASSAVAAERGEQPPATLEVVPLIHQGEQVGELRLAPRPGETTLAPADRRLLNDLARQAGMVVHSVQLTQDLHRARVRLVTGREEERRRLRRDLHDGLGPTLASQALTIDAARLLIERDPQGAADLLRDAKAQTQAAVGEIRRVVYELRPPALDDLGLVGTLRELAGQYAGRGLNVTVEAPASLPSLAAAVEVAVFRISQEAITNVVRHAQATTCTIAISVDEGLTLTISDDGRGIPTDRRAGVGLTSMRERAEELGGSCSIISNAEGGTSVVARLPL